MALWGDGAWGSAWGDDIAATNKASASVEAAVSSFASASVAFQDLTLYTMSVGIRHGALAKAVSSVSGGGLTWTLVAQSAAGSNPTFNPRCAVFKGYATSGATTEALTVTLSGVVTNYAYSVDEWTGVDAITPVAQSNTKVNTTANLGDSVTLAAFDDATNNVAFAAFAITTNTAAVVDTSPSGYHALSNPRAGTVTWFSLLAEYHTGQDLSVAATWPSDPSYDGIVALELAKTTVFALPLIDNPPTLYAPTKVTQQLDIGLISQTPALYALRPGRTIPVGLINNAPTVYTPSSFNTNLGASGAFQVDAFQDDAFQVSSNDALLSFFIDNAPVLYAPGFPAFPQTVTLGSPTATEPAFQDDAFQDGVFQDVGVPAAGIPITTTVYTPSLTGLVVHAYVYLTGTGGWDSSEIVWDDPTVLWDASGIGGFIDQQGITFTPASIKHAIALDLIDQSPVIYTPSVGGSSFTLPFISNVGFTFTPQRFKLSLTLDDEIAYTTEVFEPVMYYTGEVDLDFIDNAPTLYEFQLNTQEIELGFIDSAGFTFTLEQVALSIALDLIDQAPTLYAPKFDAIALPEIDASGIVFDPEMVFNAPDVELDDLIDQAPVVYEPVRINVPFQQYIRLDETAEQFIDNAGVVFTFVEVELAQPQVVSLPFINQAPVLYAPFFSVPVRAAILLRAHYNPVIGKQGSYVPSVRKKGEYVS